MAENYMFFGSENHDRVYTQEDFASYFSRFFTNGVFAGYENALEVTTNSNMTVSLNTGSAHINGYMYTLEDSALTFDITNADESQDRIDSLVIRLDLVNRLISALIVEGEYSTDPVEPNITRTSNYYDLRIANILVSAGTTFIESTAITDTRTSSDCGYVIQTVQDVDLTELFANCYEQVQEVLDQIENVLSDDVAGNLLNLINTNTESIETINEMLLEWEVVDEWEEESEE